MYEYIINVLVFSSFGIASLLITPFVLIYTNGIQDANYNQPFFGYIILLAEAIYLLKAPHLNLAYAANRFKEITKPAFFEAIINIIISVLLVNRLGLIGIAIGTTVAMIYRWIFHVWYTKKIITSRKSIIYYKKIMIFVISTGLSIIICSLFNFYNLSIMNWIIHAVLYSIIFGIVLFIISMVFFKREIMYFKNYIFSRKKVVK